MAQEQQQTSQDMIHIPGVPVPPMLAKAFGYEGNAKLVAFWWEPDPKELVYTDGSVTGVGDWHPWLYFIQHPAVAPYLKSFFTAESGRRGLNAIVMDCINFNFFACRIDKIHIVLQEQERETLRHICAADHPDEIAVRLRGRHPQLFQATDPDQVKQHLHQHQQLFTELRHWLDQCLEQRQA